MRGLLWVVLLLAPLMCRAAEVVDEPLGARYSLGLTLWHMGHSARHIRGFHEWLSSRGKAPESLCPTRGAPHVLDAVLLEPELLPADQHGGWETHGSYLVSGAGDQGPTVSFPLQVPTSGCYRLWVLYYGWPTGTAVTRLRIYPRGQEHEAPIVDDEVCDYAAPEEGPRWHDTLVDLEAGEYVVRLSHVVRWWHAGKGPAGYLPRQVDCLYLTRRLWAEPPEADARMGMRSGSGQGIQWTVKEALSPDEVRSWRRWEARPLSWEQRDRQPDLFTLGHEYWKETVEKLAAKGYSDDAVPDYREDERQVVFDETWNLVANPVLARRQIAALRSDVRTDPLPFHYVWHDVAGNVPQLTGAQRPAEYGGWTHDQGCLLASYGSPSGTVRTRVPVRVPGRYTVWVLSNETNRGYSAPWIGTVSAGGQTQFVYRHEGTIPSVWMRMGEAQVDAPGEVEVAFTLDGAGHGDTYRRIYTLLLTDDPAMVPEGTVRPPWTLDMYRERAAQAGADADDQYLSWVFEDPYTPLSQEVWADHTTGSSSWPEAPVTGRESTARLVMARDTVCAVQVGLRNLTDDPITLKVSPGPLQRGSASRAECVTWRVVTFTPSGPGRQQWSPFLLLRRPSITVPPLGAAGIWLTVDGRGVPPGSYTCLVRLGGEGAQERRVRLQVRISGVAASPAQPVLVDGYTQPHEGEAYLRDFAEHGMKVWRGEMSREQMRRWGIRLLALNCGDAGDLERIRALGLSYEDWFAVIMDEPTGDSEEKLKPYIDAAKTLRDLDPHIRISFNPGEAATVPTFELLAPYCDLWLPYAMHLSEYWGGPQKWAVYRPKPWMWYTTPCLWDKAPGLPEGIAAQIRQVPSQAGRCIGTAFFALNYPWRDQWDTAYEHVPDASTMGALRSRNGPVATRTWEAIREAIQTADLAMLVRERAGAKRFEDLTDEAVRELVTSGTTEELLEWLESNPQGRK